MPPLDEFVSARDVNDSYAGMTAEQVAELAANPLFSIGAHTVDHPFLTRCEPAEAAQQIERNRLWLEATCGQRCDSIAYPAGDYSAALLDVCRHAGFSRGYAVASRSIPIGSRAPANRYLRPLNRRPRLQGQVGSLHAQGRNPGRMMDRSTIADPRRPAAAGCNSIHGFDNMMRRWLAGGGHEACRVNARQATRARYSGVRVSE